MGTEYYIIKPNTKQKFYLGRRISHLDGIVTWMYSKEAQYNTWECYEDVVFDLQENSRYFLEGMTDVTVGQIWDFCSTIYEFCDDKVYLDNDCNDENYRNWCDYEEVDTLSNIITSKEQWCSLIELIPKEDWIIQDNIIFEFKTIENYLQKLKGGREHDKG